MSKIVVYGSFDDVRTGWGEAVNKRPPRSWFQLYTREVIPMPRNSTDLRRPGRAGRRIDKPGPRDRGPVQSDVVDTGTPSAERSQNYA